ncbi:hypothetical protein GL325_08455 [Aeromicrobium sp. 636]|uniref:Uncharacterized protein n=1 Tax=Aeromicrobium senzhongii TaxID=2663859 RepID=A0A8I0EUG1_9ACTN|nr:MULTISPECIES: hypothetical protein [Aeromicrobium]MBC9226349.1 hypothetical protein [Aeromicrobium senzhongii]MCQ3998454.1 hypothetical protein [Aeromicrobium sp. 636]
MIPGTEPRAPGRSGDRLRPLAKHWAVRVLTIYALSRLVSLVAFWIGWTRFDRQGYPVPADASFLQFLARAWDGRWYGLIAEEGYPAELPRDSDGEISESPWAFLPLFPMTARLVMTVTGLPWDVVGPVLSASFGAVAVLVLFRLVMIAAPELVSERPGLPYSAVAAVSFFPAAGVFSMAYGDSLALVLVLVTLWCILRRRYVLAMVPLVLLGLTRAIALPMAAVVVWHLVHRCRTEGFRTISPREWGAAAMLGVTALISGYSWVAIAGLVLGSPAAYFEAQSPWRQGGSSTAPFAGWTWFIESWLGWAVFALLCLGIVAVTFRSWLRRLGPEFQAWGGAYIGFVVAATAMGASTPRYLLLTIVFPLLLVPAKRSFRDDLVVIVTLAALQVAWIYAVCMLEGFTP